jgi:large subunit ribosomal protein L23
LLKEVLIYLKRKGRNNTVKFRAFRASPKFRRLRRSLKHLSRTPKYEKRGVVPDNNFDKFAILKAPCSSERFYKKMETENTVIFYVDSRANKVQIKQAFFDSFGVKAQRVNTMNCFGGKKKAYIKLPKTNEASEIANKIGLI